MSSKPSCFDSQPNAQAQAENDCHRCTEEDQCLTQSKASSTISHAMEWLECHHPDSPHSTDLEGEAAEVILGLLEINQNLRSVLKIAYKAIYDTAFEFEGIETGMENDWLKALKSMSEISGEEDGLV